MTGNLNVECVQSTVEELETEVVYGPPPENGLKTSFWQKLEDYYIFAGYWFYSLLALLGPWLFFIALFIPILQILCILYVFWICYDCSTPHNGGRRLEFFKELKFWRYPRDYFPIKLVKTADLPPDTTYVFSTFPHGILVFGASTNFLSNVNHFDKAFPGIEPRIITLSSVFHWPILRELVLMFGLCASSKESILHILRGPPGSAVMLVVGGVAEALRSVPGTYRLVLKNRKGFVKLALKAGSSLVPVFSFGETNAYDQIYNDWYWWLQDKLRSSCGFPMVIVKGRGIISNSFRILPYKVPITTVVGKPIKLPKVEHPSQELIDKYHGIFVEELTNLFNKYKGKYDVNGENATLSIE